MGISPRFDQAPRESPRHAPDSAAAIMRPEPARLAHKACVKDALELARGLIENREDPHTLWVVNDNHRLIGACRLPDLLNQSPATPVTRVMDTNFFVARPRMDREQVARLFQRRRLWVVPVLDSHDHILGRIGVHDVMDVLAAEAREDALHMVGTSPRELIRPARAWTTARVRLPWLTACLACSLASAFLLRAFEPVLDRAIMLVPFISIITAMGGNVAVQSATLLLHAWIRPDDGPPNTLCFLRRELKAALILATVCGLACSFVAVTILGRGNVALALVVFPAMVTAVTAAPVAGVRVPTVLRRLGIDPTIASTPAVMALSDLMGIAFYPAIAMPFLGHLRS